MRNTVVFVNGRALAGKDTVISMARGLLETLGWETSNYSSIDPIREAICKIGLDVSAKTPEDRDLMAELGFSLEKHCRYRTERVARRFQDQLFSSRKPKNIMFVSVREQAMLERMRLRMKEDGVQAITLFVDRDVPLVTSNEADANVPSKELYELVVDNNGSLFDLSLKIPHLVRQIDEGF